MNYIIKYADNCNVDLSKELSASERAMCGYKEFVVEAFDYTDTLRMAEEKLGTTDCLGNGQYLIEPVEK